MYWLKFALSALFIVLAGMRLTRSVETIARWTRLGTAWAGAFILPLATTLPELVNSWRSIYIDAPDLAAGNLLGSCLFNLSIIAFIDFVQGRGALMPKLHTGHILNAVVVIMLASVVILGIALPEGPVIAGLGWPSLLLLIIYFYGSLLLLRYEKKVSFTSPDIKTDAQGSSGRAEFTRALVEFSIAALVIFVAGMNLTDSADLLAVQTGLGQTFVGSLFIAITTSLPEVVTTYTAVRLGELDMAIANIFGANFINLALFSFADFFYRQGSLFSAVAFEHIFSTAMVIVLVCVFIFGLVYRSKRYLVRLGYDSWLILLGYIAALVMLY